MKMVSTKARVVRRMQVAILLLFALLGLSGLRNSLALAAPMKSGAEKWLFMTGSYVSSSPAVVNGVVYVGSADDYVYALDATTGAKIWAFQTGGPIFQSSPTVVNGI